LVGRNTEQLRKLINAGQLKCLRSEGERTPIYVTDQAMRDAGFSEFPSDVGDPSVETVLGALVNQTLAGLRQENTALKGELQALRQRLMVVERHALPPQRLPPDHYPQWQQSSMTP
jgi:uncharacterized coiled-coil protein SlyX